MSTEQITSIKDTRVAEARELTSASGRARLQKCLLEGLESIQWALEFGMPIEHVFCGSGYEMMLICDETMTLEQVNRDTGAYDPERDTLLTPLFEQGYMQYRSENSGIIVITETGKQILAQLWKIVERAEQAILAGFSEDEKAQFRTYLKRIQDNCTRITKEDVEE